MTSINVIPLSSRLVGLRLHNRRGPGGVPEEPRARQLLDLESQGMRREADDQVMRDLLAEARNQIAALPGVVNDRLEEIAGITVELGLAIAREIVGEALDQGKVDPTATVARCLADCLHGADRGDLVIKLHPEDMANVQTRISQMTELGEELASATFVADATVPTGGVRAETGAGRLRYDPREVLERICAEVRREASA
ncbi:MAG: flagellar biosynthesis/type III secretory pathway protein FliH [Planctomycetota bacterium]|jgi:flagellar biosynthesis/type III secretory pathway protein FliH